MGFVPSGVTRELASSCCLPLEGVMRQSATQKRAPLSEPDHTGTLILDSQPPEL